MIQKEPQCPPAPLYKIRQEMAEVIRGKWDAKEWNDWWDFDPLEKHPHPHVGALRRR